MVAYGTTGEYLIVVELTSSVYETWYYTTVPVATPTDTVLTQGLVSFGYESYFIVTPRNIRKVFTQYSSIPENIPYVSATNGPNANNAGKTILSFSSSKNVLLAAIAINVELAQPYPFNEYPIHFLFTVGYVGTHLMLSKISTVPGVLCSTVL